MAFLEFMCPGALAEGYFPPPGSDRSVCPRPILGTYDDHDFGWNNGNRREPDKKRFKDMFLDAIGEPAFSERRNSLRGAWGKETLIVGGDNAAGSGRQSDGSASPHTQSDDSLEVDVFLLDERYDREPLPCWTNRKYCEAVLQAGAANGRNSRHAWCVDFLIGSNGTGGVGVDGVGTGGSCCRKDEEIFLGWCQDAREDPSRQSHPLWAEACDVSSPAFGRRALALDPSDSSNIIVVAGSDSDSTWSSEASEAMGYIDTEQGAPFCDVLGRPQRSWLRNALAVSNAPLKLIVSGSVVLGNPVWQDRVVYTLDDNDAGKKTTVVNASFCSSDDMDCYAAAQAELLYLAATAGGCTLLLTGDYHWSDVKVLDATNDASTYNLEPAIHRGLDRAAGIMPGVDSNNDDRSSDDRRYKVGATFPGSGVVQVMSSGLTRSTSPNESCAEFFSKGFTTDAAGLRVGEKGTCEAVVTGGSFATIHVTRKGKELTAIEILLRDRSGDVRYRHDINPETCRAEPVIIAPTSTS